MAADQRLRTMSVLRNADYMRPERIDGILKRTLNKLVEVAQEDMPGVNITVRDLVPADMPNQSNNEWTETSGSDNAYADQSLIDGSAIADETFIAIYGCQFLTGHTTPPITALRLEVGASRVAQWNLYSIIRAYTLTTSGATDHPSPLGITENPIIIRQNQTLLAQEYTIEATTAYKLAFFGFVAEKAGKTIAV